MSNELEGQTALVTGAERGIGRALAVGLARAGASVLVNYFSSRAEADETVRVIVAAGGKAVAMRGDVGRIRDARRLVTAAEKRFGKLDILINNAGIHIFDRLKDVREKDWDRMLATNLKGPFLLSQAAVASMLRRRIRGRIVNITSCGATIPFPGSAGYNASKGGLLMLTRQLALELAPQGIRVNAVCPGVVHTAMNDFLLKQPDQHHAWSDAVPMKRVSVPTDLVELAVFLCSARSEYITGQNIAVDGGWSMTVGWAVKP